jgi:hypothetical protein|tara:strand:+ start:60 stop:230 length:171 start_codon:yes stop_codon:yes gene_type:complete
MRKLFLFLFLMSCASPNSNEIIKIEVLDFDKELTFVEFNNLLTKYAEINPYPNIEE